MFVCVYMCVYTNNILYIYIYIPDLVNTPLLFYYFTTPNKNTCKSFEDSKSQGGNLEISRVK